jgi:hypothetical protein
LLPIKHDYEIIKILENERKELAVAC